MHDQPRSTDPRAGELEQAVEHLTSEVTSLKLELATLISAVREARGTAGSRRSVPAPQRRPADPPSRPSPLPAAIVVLLACALLSWQVIEGPRADGAGRRPDISPIAETNPAPSARTAQSAPIELPATEPPVTPLVMPTIYKGTLNITADRPGARVFVNRRDVGTVPVRLRNLKAGAHLVWIESEGYRRWTRVVTVPAERVTRVSAALEPLESVTGR